MSQESNSESKQEVPTVLAKYVFLDIVGFSRNRSVEAQAEIVSVLNEAVERVVDDLWPSDHLFLPTGDGICVVLIGTGAAYDAHLRVALGILKGLLEHNRRTKDETRQFSVRIALNSNWDFLVTDINRQKNIAGAGITLAQRLMELADANQVIASSSVYDALQPHEGYMHSFKSFWATIKHGYQVPAYQFVGGQYVGLDSSTPAAFRQKEATKPKLTEQAAYYLAHAIKSRGELLTRTNAFSFTGIILLWLLAGDSAARKRATELNPFEPETWGAGEKSFGEQFEYYNRLDLTAGLLLADLIDTKYLSPYSNCFETAQLVFHRMFVNPAGLKKLKEEWPLVWAEFELTEG